MGHKRILPLVLFSALALGQDPRTEELVTLDGYFPFDPPGSAQEWASRRAEVQRRVLVAAGLWPRVVRVDPEPVIWGAVEREGYTVERIYFESLPGFHVTGSLYRPTTGSGPYPGVLCPHGHWTNGRFSTISDADALAQIERGEEEHLSNARFHLQARCAQLARMGCVVLHYDMVGYADSQQLDHRGGFGDLEAELWAMNPFGLQTRNSIHALDVLLSLEDVDQTRIAVTGGSGGGTQTFVLGAVDGRPTVLFPAVMVSTAMQGGCVCENASHLRVGTGNIELAAMAAPRALGLTGADDWTKEIMTKGFPELQALYQTLGAPEYVEAWCYPTFPHNYNAVSRGHLYRFLNLHLQLGFSEPIVEPPLVPVQVEELTVYDDAHPRPAGGVTQVRAALLEIASREVDRLALLAAGDLAEYRRVVGGALRTMTAAARPLGEDVDHHLTGGADRVCVISAGYPSLPMGEALCNEPGVAIVHPFTGDLRTDHRSGQVLYTWGYNPTHLAHRVHDLRTAREVLPASDRPALLGEGDQALAALLAAALEPELYGRVAVEFGHGFDVATYDDHDFLPGAERWGGAAGYAALIAPTPLLLLGVDEVPSVLRRAYAAAGAPEAVRAIQDPVAGELAAWLLR